MKLTNFIDFHLGSWKIGNIDSSSGVFVGHNLQYGWRRTEKENTTGRQIAGDYAHITGGTNEIIDPDILDTWIQKLQPGELRTPPSPVLMRLLDRRKHSYRSQSPDPWEWDT